MIRDLLLVAAAGVAIYVAVRLDAATRVDRLECREMTHVVWSQASIYERAHPNQRTVVLCVPARDRLWQR